MYGGSSHAQKNAQLRPISNATHPPSTSRSAQLTLQLAHPETRLAVTFVLTVWIALLTRIPGSAIGATAIAWYVLDQVLQRSLISCLLALAQS
jgi:hypothetical protein